MPVIDWNRFLERIVELGDTPLAEFDSFEVLINAKDYLNDLRGLLDQTSDETLHNYLLWRIVLSSKNFFFRFFHSKNCHKVLSVTIEPIKLFQKHHI